MVCETRFNFLPYSYYLYLTKIKIRLASTVWERAVEGWNKVNVVRINNLQIRIEVH